MFTLSVSTNKTIYQQSINTLAKCLIEQNMFTLSVSTNKTIYQRFINTLAKHKDTQGIVNLIGSVLFKLTTKNITCLKVQKCNQDFMKISVIKIENETNHLFELTGLQ
jgi:hypothetical protein